MQFFEESEQLAILAEKAAAAAPASILVLDTMSPSSSSAAALNDDYDYDTIIITTTTKPKTRAAIANGHQKNGAPAPILIKPKLKQRAKPLAPLKRVIDDDEDAAAAPSAAATLSTGPKRKARGTGVVSTPKKRATSANAAGAASSADEPVALKPSEPQQTRVKLESGAASLVVNKRPLAVPLFTEAPSPPLVAPPQYHFASPSPVRDDGAPPAPAPAPAPPPAPAPAAPANRPRGRPPARPAAYIQNTHARNTTFSKRKTSVFKKVTELRTLTEAPMLISIVSPCLGHMWHYAPGTEMGRFFEAHKDEILAAALKDREDDERLKQQRLSQQQPQEAGDDQQQPPPQPQPLARRPRSAKRAANRAIKREGRAAAGGGDDDDDDDDGDDDGDDYSASVNSTDFNDFSDAPPSPRRRLLVQRDALPANDFIQNMIDLCGAPAAAAAAAASSSQQQSSAGSDPRRRGRSATND